MVSACCKIRTVLRVPLGDFACDVEVAELGLLLEGGKLVEDSHNLKKKRLLEQCNTPIKCYYCFSLVLWGRVDLNCL